MPQSPTAGNTNVYHVLIDHTIIHMNIQEYCIKALAFLTFQPNLYNCAYWLNYAEGKRTASQTEIVLTLE